MSTTTPLPPFVRSTLLEILHNRETTVKFRKSNGDIRKMVCTLRLELMPQIVQDKLIAARLLEETEKKTPNLELVTVYDLEAKDWRSFRVDSIIEVL